MKGKALIFPDERVIAAREGVFPGSGVFLPSKWRYFTLTEASKATGLTREILKVAIRAGRLPATQVNVESPWKRRAHRVVLKWKILESDLLKFVERHFPDIVKAWGS